MFSTIFGASIKYLDFLSTVCPGRSDPFYIVIYYTKWVTTSQPYSILTKVFFSRCFCISIHFFQSPFILTSKQPSRNLMFFQFVKLFISPFQNASVSLDSSLLLSISQSFHLSSSLLFYPCISTILLSYISLSLHLSAAPSLSLLISLSLSLSPCLFISPFHNASVSLYFSLLISIINLSLYCQLSFSLCDHSCMEEIIMEPTKK